MEKQYILAQIDFAQKEVDKIGKKVMSIGPEEKGFKEITDSYNKWIDRLGELQNELVKLDEFDSERARLALENRRLDIEADKIAMEYERIQRTEAESRKNREFEERKFAYEKKKTIVKEPIDYILKGLEIGVKVFVPFTLLHGSMKMADMAYQNDLNFTLCNGNVRSFSKTAFDLATKIKV